MATKLYDKTRFVEFIVKNPMDNDVIKLSKMIDGDFPDGFSGKKVLVVGCLEEPFANTIADLGADVTGVDLRAYEMGDISNGYDSCLYIHIVGDMRVLKLEDKFALIISCSVVVYTCLGYYKEIVDPVGDSEVMSAIYDHLKDDGVCYITVPIGGSWKETNHWRRYTLETISRLTSKFKELDRDYFETSYLGFNDVDEEAVKNYHDSTDISVLLKLGKK